MKIRMNIKNMSPMLGLFLLATAVFLAIPVHHALADYGRASNHGYFTNNSDSPYILDKVWNGGTVGTQNGILDLGSNPTKAALEAFVKAKLGSSDPQDRVGAAFIIETMIGRQGSAFTSVAQGIAQANADYTEWVTRVNNPAVSTSVRNFAYTSNSAYEVGGGDITTYADSGTQPALVFSIGGVTKYVIKQICANPLGDFPGLPDYTASSWSGNPSTSVSGGTWNVGGTTTFTDTVAITKTGAPTGTYTYDVWGGWFASPTAGHSGFVDHLATNTKQPVTSGYNRVAGVTGGAGNAGNYYCEYVFITPTSSTNGAGTYSNTTCKQLVKVDKPPVGTLTLACAANGTATIKNTFSDPDGATTATIEFKGNGLDLTRNAALAAYNPWNIGATDAAGPWSATLVVQDNGGSSDLTISKANTGCNAAPTGAYIAANCDQVSAWMYDPNNTSLSLQYVVYVNGTRRGPATTNMLYQPANNQYNPNDKTSKHAFTADPNIWSQYNPRTANTIEVRAIDPVTGTETSLGLKNIAACVSPTCTSTFPGTMTVGDPQTFAVKVDMGVAFGPPWVAPTNPALTVTVSGPSGYTTQNFTPGYTAAGQVISSGPVTFTPSVPGAYHLNWTLTGLASADCGYGKPIGSPNVGNAGFSPYFRAEAGDVVAGAGFTTASGCTPITGNSKITAANAGSPGFVGAGGQLGAIALGQISGFATSTNDDGSSSGVTSPSSAIRAGLAFANTSPSLGLFGSLPCMTDYAATVLAATTPETPPPSTDLSTLSGTHTYHFTGPGPLTIVGGVLPAGAHITFVVDGGDVVIQNNITYASYASLADVPQFQLLVAGGGTIHIMSTVSELHGVYDAQANATGGGGIVSTCYNGTADTVVGCSTQLTFYGAVVANKILLERTIGSFAAGPGVPVQPAEIFNDTPELWAASVPTPVHGGAQKFDAITSLPPVL